MSDEMHIAPDTAHPLGGYAWLDLKDGPAAGTEVMVTIFDTFQNRYLSEEEEWQTVPSRFGPYKVEDGNPPRVLVGPEIVNKIEAWQTVSISVGEVDYQAVWPDDVIPAPGARPIGRIHTGEEDDTDALTGGAGGTGRDADPHPRGPDDEETGDEETGDDETGTDDEDTTVGGPGGDGTATPPRRKWLPYAGIAVLALAAGLAWFLFYHDGSDEGDELIARGTGQNDPPPVPPPLPPEPEPEPCSAEAFAAAGDGFAAQEAIMRGCADTLGGDGLMERLQAEAARDDPRALLLLGQLNDPAIEDPMLEGDLAMSFGDRPDTAAEYYSRAVTAGAEDAEAPLAAICDRLRAQNDAMAELTVDAYCPDPTDE